MDRRVIYFDHNATTAPAPELGPLISQWLESYGNPSSIHWAGRPAKLILRDARRAFAQLINCDPLEVIFTGGGSEANNTALKGVFEALAEGQVRNELIISAVEHPSVIRTAEHLSRQGYRVHVIPVTAQTGFDERAFDRALSEKTALVSVMLANNETGHIFPIRELSTRAHNVGAAFHCDAVQSLGKTLVDMRELGVDLATFSGHKFYALKGIGALFAKKGFQVESLIHGGGQERGRRAGTENTLGIASLGWMAKKAPEIEPNIMKMQRLRDMMEAEIRRSIPDIEIIGQKSARICNTSCIVIDGIDGETLLMNLDVQGFAVSTGAACSAGNPEPSPVLIAMGLTRQQAQSSLRVSFGWHNTRSEVEKFVDVLTETVSRLRGLRALEVANV